VTAAALQQFLSALGGILRRAQPDDRRKGREIGLHRPIKMPVLLGRLALQLCLVPSSVTKPLDGHRRQIPLRPSVDGLCCKRFPNRRRDGKTRAATNMSKADYVEACRRMARERAEFLSKQKKD
jgi:hypothetical protein